MLRECGSEGEEAREALLRECGSEGEGVSK